MQAQTVLMSVKPQFVAMILAGDKDVELRRRLPSFVPGTRVYLYSSFPDKAIMGWVCVQDIHYLPKEELWQDYGHRTGIGWEEFSAYLKGVSQACGIEVSNPRHLQDPISLDVLREHCQGFRPPPQSYQFVKPQGTLAYVLGVFPRAGVP